MQNILDIDQSECSWIGYIKQKSPIEAWYSQYVAVLCCGKFIPFILQKKIIVHPHALF